MMFLKRYKHKDDTLEQAISFMKKQKELNMKNMKTIKEMNFSIDDMKEWNRIYDYVITRLKSMRE